MGRAYLASSQLRKVCPSSTRPLSRVWACSAWHSPSQCRSTEHPQPFHRRGRSRHALRASQPDAEQSTSYAEQASNELSLTGQAKGRSENSAHSSNGAHTSHAAQQGVAQQPADRAEPAASAISPYTPADIPSSRNGLKQQAQQQDAPARSEIPSQLARVAEQGPAASSNGMGYVGDQMQLGSHDAQIAQQLGSEPGIEASPLPEPKVKIRVAHPTSIKTSREKHWALLKSIVPADRWKETAVVLACLESIYRSEYLAIGQDAVAALQAANAVPVPPGYLAPPPDTTPRLKRRPSPRRGRDDAPALTPQPRRRRSRVTTEDTAGAAAGPRGPSAAPQMDVAAVAEAVSEVAEAAAAGAAAAMVAAAEAAVEAAASAAESALQPPRESEEEMLIATANRLDTEFSMLLAQLVRRAHFEPLTRREVEVAKNLNRDYLSQLFIVGDLRKMDRGLVRAVRGVDAALVRSIQGTQGEAAGEAAGGDADTAALATWDPEMLPSTLPDTNGSNGSVQSVQPDAASTSASTWGSTDSSPIQSVDKQRAGSPLPPSQGLESLWGPADAPALETDSVVLLKRCWGEEASTGRLVLQKLDFLQTLVVTAVLDQIRAALVTSAREVRSYLADLATTARQLSPPRDTLWVDTLQQPIIPPRSIPTNGSVQQSVPSPRNPATDTTQLPVTAPRSIPTDTKQQPVPPPPRNPATDPQQQPLTPPRTTITDASQGGMVEGVPNSAQDSDTAIQQTMNQPHSPHIDASQAGVVAVVPNTAQGSVQDEPAWWSRGAAGLGRRLADGGRAAARWLSERGVGPRLDILPLQQIDQLLPVEEPARLQPLTLTKVALRDVMGNHPLRDGVGGLVQRLFAPISLSEPTIKEFAVVYRRVSGSGGWRTAVVRSVSKAGRRLKLLPPQAPQPPKPRPPIQIRIYRDIALPTWQLALPDKLLQFRPLDLLQADLFALTGLIALLAQARYDSLVLDVITFISATVFIVRIALGFKRMDDRYRSQVAEVLRDKTIASDATALEYLAAAAGLQQFKQVSLAYLCALYLLPHQHTTEAQDPSTHLATSNGHVSDPATMNGTVSQEQGQVSSQPTCVPASCESVAGRVELLLRGACKLQVRFEAEEAFHELGRLGLATPVSTEATTSTDAHSQQPSELVQAAQASASPPGTETQELSGTEYRVVSLERAKQLIEKHWSGLLWQRVDGILREFED